MMLTAARALNMFTTGVLAGIGVGGFASEAGVHQLDGTSYAKYGRVRHKILTPLTLGLILPALASGAMIAASSRDDEVAFNSSVAGLVTEAIAFLISLGVNVPINRAIRDEWDVENPPPNWAEMRDRWNKAHYARTFLALASLGCQIAAWQQAPRERGRRRLALR